MNKVKKFIKIFLGIPLTVIAFIFIGKIFFDSLPQIKESLLNANPALILIGIFLMLGFFLVRSIAWTKVLEFYGESEKSVLESVYSYSLAETKRYIPGNIFSFVSRIQKFSSESFTKKTIIKALVLEAFVMVVSAVFVSLPAIFDVVRFNYLYLLLIIALVLVTIFVKKNIFKSQTFILSIFPRKNIFQYINVISISSLAWTLFGLGNYFFLSSIFPNDPNLILKISSIFILAWLIGYISFVTPMGLGVREAVLVFLLSPVLPLFAGATIAIFTRILFVLSEILFLAVSFILHKKIKTKNLKNLLPALIISLSSLSYATYTIYFSVQKHLNFYTGKFDLGNMENTVWNTVNGRFFMYSNPDGVGELSRLSAHSDFILVLFAPFYALYPSANLLLIIQSLVIGLGGFFVYLIAKKIIKSERLSVLLSVGYFLNYFVAEQNLFDFHSVSLATTFLLGTFYFLLEKKYKLMSLMLLLAVITKENVYLVSALFGGFLFIQGKRIFGSTIFIISLLVFYLLMSYFIPNARSGDHFALSYLSYLGDSPLSIILSPILKPTAFFGRVFSIETLEYVAMNFLPVGFLSILAPQYIVFMLPDFLISILSDNPNLRSIQYHYGALLVPFIYISAIFGVKKALSFNLKIINKNTIFYYLLFFTIFSAYQFSPLPGMKNGDTAAFKEDKNRQMVYREIGKIPFDKSVSATNNIAAHLVQREKIYVIPNVIDSVDYLVFYKENMDIAEEIIAYRKDYVLVFRSNNLIILKKFTPPDRAYTP